MAINLNHYALERELRSFAERNDVELVLHHIDDPKEAASFVPYASKQGNTKQVHLLAPDPNWTDEEITRWRAGFYHEIGHFHPKVIDDYAIAQEKKFNTDSMFGMGYNCLSDYRQEKVDLGVYCGRDAVLSKGNALAVGDIMDKHGEKLKDIEPTSDAGVMFGLLGFTVKARENWQRDLTGSGDQLIDNMHPVTAERVQKAIDTGYVDKLNACDSAKDLYALWEDMLANVFMVDVDEKKQEAAEQMQKSEAGGGSEGDKGEEKAEGCSEHGDGDKPRDKKAEIDWRELQLHEHDTPAQAIYNPLKINYADSDFTGGNKWQVAKYKDLDIINWEKGEGNKVANYYNGYVSRHNIHTGLSNKVRKLLQVKTQTLKVNGMKKGKLAPKSIYRAAMGNEVGAYGEKVFSKKIQKYDLDVAISIVSDFSGSMGGDKMTHTIVCALMLNEAISKLGVPIEIIGFTHRSTSILNIFKTFKKPVQTEELKARMCAAANNMGNNADGEALLFAYNRLVQQPNKRKLMIVLSDGQPACRGRGNIVKFTKDVVEQIQKDKQVEIYGIGLEDDTVKRFYKHYRVIKHSNELEEAVLGVIKNNIIK